MLPVILVIQNLKATFMFSLTTSSLTHSYVCDIMQKVMSELLFPRLTSLNHWLLSHGL